MLERGQKRRPWKQSFRDYFFSCLFSPFHTKDSQCAAAAAGAVVALACSVAWCKMSASSNAGFANNSLPNLAASGILQDRCVDRFGRKVHIADNGASDKAVLNRRLLVDRRNDVLFKFVPVTFGKPYAGTSRGQSQRCH